MSAEELIEELLKRRPSRPINPWAQTIIIAQIVAEQLAGKLPAPALPVPEAKPPPPPALKPPQLKTYFAESVTPSKPREEVFKISGTGVLVDFTLRSTSDAYFVVARRDRAALYTTKALSHETWRALAIQLSKVVAHREAGNGHYVWGIQKVPFGREFKVVVVDGEGVTFDQVVATWELIE